MDTAQILGMLMMNPQTRAIAEKINGGADPKEIFYQLCKERGVDPNSILRMLGKGTSGK